VRRGGRLLAIWLLLAPLAAAAAPVPDEERAQILAGLQEAQQRVTTLRAAVVQRKRHPLLKAEVVREGTLLLARPDRLRWEILRPERWTLVADGATLLVYRPDRREVERRDLRDDLSGRAALGFLLAGLRFDLAELERRFEVAVARETGQLRLTLAPRSRWLAQAVARIEIVQPDGDPVPSRFVVAGPRGDRTETRLGSLEINPRLAEDAFALRLGPGVRVVDARRAPDGADSGR
jgi:outer membrane lipoprotein-sorting protein